MAIYSHNPFGSSERALFVDDFPGATYHNRVWAVSGTGSVTSQPTIGGGVLLSATAGASYQLYFSTIRQFSAAQNAQITWRGLMTPAASTGIAEVGFMGSATTDIAAWRWAQGTSAQWICYTGAAGTFTTQLSGISADNSYHDFGIMLATGSAKFYLDGVLIQTVSTNVPTVDLQPLAFATASATVVSTINISKCVAYGDRL